jgi:VanZ family protein
VLPLRYPYVWLSVGWLLVIVVILGSLLPGPVIREITPPLSDKLEHFSAYFALTIWFCGLYPRVKYLRIAAALLLLGIALDVIQGTMTTTRSFELLDITADAVGIAVALGLASWLLEGWCQRLERLTISSA